MGNRKGPAFQPAPHLLAHLSVECYRRLVGAGHGAFLTDLVHIRTTTSIVYIVCIEPVVACGRNHLTISDNVNVGRIGSTPGQVGLLSTSHLVSRRIEGNVPWHWCSRWCWRRRWQRGRGGWPRDWRRGGLWLRGAVVDRYTERCQDNIDRIPERRTVAAGEQEGNRVIVTIVGHDQRARVASVAERSVAYFDLTNKPSGFGVVTNQNRCANAHPVPVVRPVVRPYFCTLWPRLAETVVELGVP